MTRRIVLTINKTVKYKLPGRGMADARALPVTYRDSRVIDGWTASHGSYKR